MDATTETDIGGRVVATTSVMGLWGKISGQKTDPQPAGEDKSNPMQVTALQTEGIPIQFTTYRPSSIDGGPIWREFVKNIGDVDTLPIQASLLPRQMKVPGMTYTAAQEARFAESTF
jgi:hypothetical protein